MKLLTITNLYPRPDRPQAGMFNAQLFRELAARLAADGGALANAVLVPQWRVWRRNAVRSWASPYAGGHPTRYLPAFYVPGLGRDWSWFTYGVSAGPPLAAAVREADAVFCSWLYPDGVLAANLAAAAGKPLWLMALGSDVQHLDGARRGQRVVAACGAAAGVICVGEHLAARLRAAGVPPDRVHVAPNGVDAARFRHADRAAARQRLAEAGQLPGRLGVLAAPAARIVLFVGNLVRVKAPDALVLAFAAVVRRQPDVPLHLVLVGTGPLAGRVHRRSVDQGVSERVHAVGALDHAQVATWMNAADCLCLCSRSEGMPNVVLEALASGLPVVATDVGACRAMLAGEPAARVVPPGDTAALAEALQGVLTEPVDRASLAARHGRRTWCDQAADILELIRTR